MDQKLEDKFITCVECGFEFLFEVGEQVFYKTKGLVEPKRCPTCRRKRKESLEASKEYRK